MGHKNDYSAIVFYPSGPPKKWQYVHKINDFSAFLSQKHPGWKYMNIYERRTAKFLKRFYAGNPLPDFI
jgi:uncharacterized GH25 family protein